MAEHSARLEPLDSFTPISKPASVCAAANLPDLARAREAFDWKAVRGTRFDQSMPESDYAQMRSIDALMTYLGALPDSKSC